MNFRMLPAAVLGDVHGVGAQAAQFGGDDAAEREHDGAISQKMPAIPSGRRGNQSTLPAPHFIAKGE